IGTQQTKLKQQQKIKQRPANSRLPQWGLTWLIEHSTSHQLLWCIDSFVLPCLPAGREIPHCGKRQNVSYVYELGAFIGQWGNEKAR
ncbi:MAG: hypothetical protein ACK52X_06485, partial [bacterium]